MSSDGQTEIQKTEREARRDANHAKDMALMASAYSPAEYDGDGRLVKQARCIAHQNFISFVSPAKKTPRPRRRRVDHERGSACHVGERAAKLIRRHVRAVYSTPGEREVAERLLRGTWSELNAKARGELALRLDPSRAMRMTRRERVALGQEGK